MTECSGLCKVFYDWQTMIVGAVAACLGVLAYEAAQKQVDAVKATLQADSMFKLIDRFDSPSFSEFRKAATRSCLEHLADKNPHDSSVDELLDLFDDAAFLVKNSALDIKMMWHSFYYWINLYYQAAENYIKECRDADPTQWNALCELYPRLHELEANARRAAGKTDTYIWKIDDTQLREKLEKEFPNNSADEST